LDLCGINLPEIYTIKLQIYPYIFKLKFNDVSKEILWQMRINKLARKKGGSQAQNIILLVS